MKNSKKSVWAFLFLITAVWCFANAASANDSEQRRQEIAGLYITIAEKLADARSANRVCELDAYQSTINQALAEANRQSWQYTENRLKDSAILNQEMAASLAFKEFRGDFDVLNLDKIRRSLAGIVMYGPHQGAYGNTKILTFAEGGKLEFSRLVLLDKEPWYKWVKREGTWSVSVESNNFRKQAVVTVSVPGVFTKKYLLTTSNLAGWREYVLVPYEKPKANPYFEGYTDYPSECEA